MTQQTIHAFISGRVQGVWYRASTRETAKKLGITGWVKNLADGRVELVATGEPHVLEQFIVWCKKGPPLAKVREVDIQAMPLEKFSDFT